MFHHRPVLAAELLDQAMGVNLPTFTDARIESGEYSDVTPTQYRADAVVLLSAGAKAVGAVIVEVQLHRDRKKRWSWPVYLATLRARLRCPTLLLVLCADERSAQWCAGPIDMGHPGWRLTPLVLGPDRVPVITEAMVAKEAPELAVLSAMAHGAGAEGKAVLDALFIGLVDVDAEHAALYSDVVLAALPEAAKQYMEALVTTGTYEYQSDFVRRFIFQGRAEGKVEGKAEGKAEGRAEGKAEGEAAALLAVLDARDIDVPDDARDRITACVDLEQLNRWIRRAVAVETIEDLFD